MLSVLATNRAHIAHLSAQIEDLERGLAALRLEKMVAQARLDSSKYSVLTLPTEIISEIFVHFLPTYSLCPPVTGILSPTVLTHVCHEWGAIALATPELWRAMAFSGFLAKQFPLSDFLDRSSCRPLSIMIDEWANVHPRGLRHSEILAAIVPHCTRWEYVTIRLAETELPLIPGPFPLLRELDIWLEHFRSPTAFQGLSQLRAVALNDTAALHFVLPWMQITRLNLLRVYVHECVLVLRQTSNLVHCELQLYFDPDRADDLLDVITLPCLELLTFNDPNPSATPACINPPEVLITPALRNLDVPERFLGTKPIRSLTSFISKSGCKLQDLCITGKRSMHRESYRAAFPSIPRLCFEDSQDGSGS